MDDGLDSTEIIALRELGDQLERFREEVDAIVETLVLPNWSGRLHGMVNTLYGSLMRCFSFVDLFSALERGRQPRKQTERMTDFLVRRANVGRREALVSVKVWRHMLMHTAAPRPLVVQGSSLRYDWLLHWGHHHLSRSQHFKFSAQEDSYTLALGLEYLIEDLSAAFRSYVEDLTQSPKLISQFRETREAVMWEVLKSELPR